MEQDEKRVLVVDDEPDVVESLKDYLGRRGYQVQGALSGEQALDILEKEKADIILMDIMMPGIKGTEASRLIKSKYPAVKVIILTAYPQAAQDLILDKVSDAVLAKPAGMQDIFAKLSGMLKEKESINQSQGIEARVLFIRAKVLLLDLNENIADALSLNLKSLDTRGEYYDVARVSNTEELVGAISISEPDLILVNATFVDKARAGKESAILDDYLRQGRMIIYNAPVELTQAQAESLVKTVQIYSFRNGLIEVKWVKI